jgi:hypothetical protein
LEAARRELLKRWERRLGVGLLGLAALLLVDEWVKEGYLFWPGDLLTASLTHEKLVVLLVALGAGVLARHWGR